MIYLQAALKLLGGWRAVAFLALAVAAWMWGGSKAHALGEAREDTAQEVTKRQTAETALATANERISGFRVLLDQVNAASDEQVAQARERAAAGEAAAKAASAEAARLATRLTDAQTALQKAKDDPRCADQLRMSLCPAIPLL